MCGSMTTGTQDILDVDLLKYEQGGADERRAVVDGVTRSLEREESDVEDSDGEPSVEETSSRQDKDDEAPADSLDLTTAGTLPPVAV